MQDSTKSASGYKHYLCRRSNQRASLASNQTSSLSSKRLAHFGQTPTIKDAITDDHTTASAAQVPSHIADDSTPSSLPGHWVEEVTVLPPEEPPPEQAVQAVPAHDPDTSSVQQHRSTQADVGFPCILPSILKNVKHSIRQTLIFFEYYLVLYNINTQL